MVDDTDLEEGHVIGAEVSETLLVEDPDIAVAADSEGQADTSAACGVLRAVDDASGPARPRVG
ncbi:hypothetical protein [Streptomyces sp. NPDC016675]|uniref:hypothetical protein n=1 Tax=Streptomyces sp. NPDC016675 TaxID=3364970 RepID=UPI0036FE26A4